MALSDREEGLSRPERIEARAVDPELFERALEHVAAVSRWGGALGRMTRELRRASEGRRGRLLLLDVGSGNGDLARRLALRGGSETVRWTVHGIDEHPEAVRIAAARGGRAAGGAVIRGDARALPFADRSFDAVLCTLTLHHFREEEAIEVVREMGRVTRRLVIVNDLERRRLALLGAKLLAGTLWLRNTLTRHDGPLSVRRGFTAPELLRIGEAAGLESPVVRRAPFFRLVLTAGPGRTATARGERSPGPPRAAGSRAPVGP